MSSNVWPPLPGASIEVKAAPVAKTGVFESRSGREQRTKNWTTLRERFTVTFRMLRTNVAAPSPYAAYSELGVIRYFHSLHAGAFDTFLLPHPVTGANVTVRFEDDELDLKKERAGWWSGEVHLISVI